MQQGEMSRQTAIPVEIILLMNITMVSPFIPAFTFAKLFKV
jgi:hypothetical protein